VAAVVLFHYPTRGFIRGGLVGVDVFFALSGFLVTAGLLDEWSDTGGIRVQRFLRRPAWRLVPALVGLLSSSSFSSPPPPIRWSAGS
jgi:peptidoglycan/LPS O-acetylase OafA/YrhL